MRGILDFIAGQLGESDNGLQEVVNLVRRTAGKVAQRFHLLGLAELSSILAQRLLDHDFVGHVGGGAPIALEPALVVEYRPAAVRREG